ncbi:MAG TPA: prenyltransferase [Thermoanaerobaculia bacterium]|nr:prenyltransferase [Thermoanaerobaculia bacterium]
MTSRTFPLFSGSERQTAWFHGVWRLVDPKIALASLVPFIVGMALVYGQGAKIDLLIAGGAFIAIFLVEVGKNALNDLIDWRSGTDASVTNDERSPFSGGKRVIVDALLNEKDLVVIAIVAFLAAGLIGGAIAYVTRPSLLILGAVAALVAIEYSVPPLKFSYRGLGELAVLLTYGPGIVIGSVLLFGGRVNADVITTSLVLGLIIANVLFINEMPDERADREAGKRTLVVRLGRKRAARVFGLVFATAFALAVIRFAFGGSPALLGLLLGIFPADYAFWSLREQPSGPPVASQAATLIAYVTTGAGLIFIIWLSSI